MSAITALVISSLNDLGLNIVRRFVQQGYNIVLNGSQHDADRIEKECQSSGIVYIRDEPDRYKLVQQALTVLHHIDVVIINNECKRHYRASIEEFPIEKWKDIIDENLISTFDLVKTLWPYMKRQHFGRIITIANEHSLAASEYQSACVASHYALIGLNKALTIEGASFGITSNIICPGYRQENLSEPYNHLKTLADLVLFLCTDQARSITGQTIHWNSKSFDF